MPKVSRVGDMGIGICDAGAKCCPHVYTFVIIGGSPDSTAEGGMPIARIGDGTATTCPHCPAGIIVSGSPSVFANGIPVARLGDDEKVPCGSAVITTGAGTVDADDN